jgi:hypothetical protein
MDNSGERRSADHAGQQPFPSVRPGHAITRIVSRTEEVAHARSDATPIERRTIPNGHRATDNSGAGAVRRGARLASRALEPTSLVSSYQGLCPIASSNAVVERSQQPEHRALGVAGAIGKPSYGCAQGQLAEPANLLG